MFMSYCEYKERLEVVQEWINERVKNNEINYCMFYITVPGLLEENGKIYDYIKELLDEYQIGYQFVDTVSGSWNLNQDWIETELIECAIEYCGVYPTNWDIEDVIKFEDLINEGKLVVQVYIKTDDGKLIPNV